MNQDADYIVYVHVTKNIMEDCAGLDIWQKSIDLSQDSNHGSLVIRTSALPTELPSLHNFVIQILGFLLTTPASMVSSTYRPEAESRVAGVRAWYKGCGRVHVYMFATDTRMLAEELRHSGDTFVRIITVLVKMLSINEAHLLSMTKTLSFTPLFECLSFVYTHMHVSISMSLTLC